VRSKAVPVTIPIRHLNRESAGAREAREGAREPEEWSSFSSNRYPVLSPPRCSLGGNNHQSEDTLKENAYSASPELMCVVGGGNLSLIRQA